MNTQFEKNKLYAYLGEDLVDTLKAYKAYIAGGTITSLFCNREINDIDIYFRDEDSIVGFLYEIWDNQKWVVSHTKKATQIQYGDVNIQLIHFQYFNSPEDIFDTFDFTSCMAAYDFSTEQFIFHPDFIKHNSQRILKFNSNTAFPIVSLLRVQKYENKGYSISKPEFIRIILTCMNLEISTYEELKEQLGGMYGINYDKLFEDVQDKEFDLETAINKIADITLSEDYFTKPDSVKFNNVDEILEGISNEPVNIFYIKDKLYKIGFDKLLHRISEKKKPIDHIEIDTTQYFAENKFYKFVKKVDGKYFSYHDNHFEYKLNQEVEAKGIVSDYGHSGRLHMSEKFGIWDSTYADRKDAVAIELDVNLDDFLGGDKGHLTVRKCTPLREVSKEEYEQWK